MPGPLEGIRVLDLSWGIAGPLGVLLLAEHGADVIKVEPPGGDPFRAYDGARVWNRSRRSVTVDLKKDEAPTGCAGSSRAPTWWSRASGRASWNGSASDTRPCTRICRG